MNEYTVLKIIAALGIGLAVGGGLMVLALVKWGRTILFPGTNGTGNCALVPICSDHSGIVKDIGFLATECKGIWAEIKDINVRQISLREKLPKEYVSKEDLGEIKSRLRSIDEKMDSYFLRAKFEER